MRMLRSHEKIVPPVIRSRQHLASQGVRLALENAVAPITLPIVTDGVTYNMAQEVSWLDDRHFAIGRWDGSLSIFAFNDSRTAGPIISKAINTPALEGVQMITWLAPRLFASSNDNSSIVLWSTPSGTWSDLQQSALLRYDEDLGVANSGESVTLGGDIFLAVGHASGFVSLWAGAKNDFDWKMLATVDLRNAHPTNPWNLHNIRGISLLNAGLDEAYLVTGSEDGFISVVRIPDGQILSQTVYNPAAQRGINSVSAFGNHVLIANCAVGSDDKNLWYFVIDEKTWKGTLVDSKNLRVNASAPQVFNFCSIWGRSDGQPCFFASTEEGALWMGTVGLNRGLNVLGYEIVYGNLGSAMAYNVNGTLVVINYNLYEFRTESMPALPAHAQPERFLMG